jgi:hypothetical protein
MADKTLGERINEVSDGVIGVLAGITAARGALGDEIVAKFLDKVPEKGEALWKRFRSFRDLREGMTFGHFVVAVATGMQQGHFVVAAAMDMQQ